MRFGQGIAFDQVDALLLLVAPAKEAVHHRKAIFATIFQFLLSGEFFVSYILLVLIKLTYIRTSPMALFYFLHYTGY